ncbi:MAG TPA: tungsten cofactor oxidoreductase radical SAM maturase [Clostridiales bacterium UBA8153]|nr:tungsten cofactor oxidoreductase radical SAM maturase [Clostridiales bacterium UBA8153]
MGRYQLTATTNVLELHDGQLDGIVAAVDRLVISIDGMHERFASIRGAKLEGVLDGIDRLNRLKAKRASGLPQLALQLVVSRDSIDDIFRMVDLAHALNVHVLMVVNLIPQTPENAQKILYTRYENRDMAVLFKKLSTYAGRKSVSLQLPHYELRTERRCNFVEGDATLVGADGGVFPCYRLSHSYREYVFGRGKTVLKHSFGNVRQQRLGDIWESRAYADFRHTVRNNLYPSCTDCDLADGCAMVRDTASDCYAGAPSCADCLWARKIAYCP